MELARWGTWVRSDGYNEMVAVNNFKVQCQLQKFVLLHESLNVFAKGIFILSILQHFLWISTKILVWLQHLFVAVVVWVVLSCIDYVVAISSDSCGVAWVN